VLKLPKDVTADPRHDAVLKLFSNTTQRWWEGGSALLPTVPWTDALKNELRGALVGGLACQGLELITDKLANEQRGLDAVRDKNPSQAQNARISRVLFVANDGSVRFYRDGEALHLKYGQRLLACRVDVTGDELGLALFGNPKLVRSVLITDKGAAARALLSLVAE
jgi:hypothetical protein